jgi:hypothetical protein
MTREDFLSLIAVKHLNHTTQQMQMLEQLNAKRTLSAHKVTADTTEAFTDRCPVLT